MDANAGGVGPPGERRGMGTLAKVAIGCGVVLLLCCVGLSYFIIKVAKWAKESADYALGVDTETKTLLAKAAEASPFEEPGTPTTTAERVEVLLKVRERVHPTAKLLEDFLEGKVREPDFWGNVKRGVGIPAEVADIRKEFAQVLTEEKMSEAEYRFLFRLAYLSGSVNVAQDLQRETPDTLKPIENVPEETAAILKGFAERIAGTPVSWADLFILVEKPTEIVNTTR